MKPQNHPIALLRLEASFSDYSPRLFAVCCSIDSIFYSLTVSHFSAPTNRFSARYYFAGDLRTEEKDESKLSGCALES